MSDNMAKLNNGIQEGELVVCPWCSVSEPVEKWDECTLGECKNREMRRDFKSLQKHAKQVMRAGSKHYYKCPACGQWCNAHKLRIDTDDTELQKLGGGNLFGVTNE